MSGKWLSDKEIGKRVRAIRLAMDLSQKEFAARLGRPGSQAEISELETATRKAQPDANLLNDIAHLAGHSIEHFQKAGVDDERREKLVAAKWMRRIADELTEDALANPSAEDARRAHSKASRAKGEKKGRAE